MDQSSKKIIFYRQKFTQFKDFVQRSTEKTKYLVDQNQNMETTLRRSNQEADLLKLDKFELEKFIQAQQAQLKNSEEMLGSLRQGYQNLIQQLEELTDSKIRDAGSQQKEEIQSLKLENGKLRSQNQELEEAVKRLQECEETRMRISEQVSYNQKTNESRINSIFDLLENYEKRIDEIPEKLGKCSHEYEDEIEGLKTNLSSKEEEIKSLKVEIRKKETMISELRTQNRSLEMELEEERSRPALTPNNGPETVQKGDSSKMEEEEVSERKVTTAVKGRVGALNFGFLNSTTGKAGKNFRVGKAEKSAEEKKKTYVCYECQFLIKKVSSRFQCKVCQLYWHKKCLPRGTRKRGFVCESCKAKGSQA